MGTMKKEGERESILQIIYMRSLFIFNYGYWHPDIWMRRPFHNEPNHILQNVTPPVRIFSHFLHTDLL